VVEVQGFFLGVRPAQAQDWMILKLKKKIGRILGYLSTAEFSSADLHEPKIFIPGYDTTFSRNMGTSMSLNQVAGRVKVIREDGAYLHDVPTGVGASGGPLLQFKDGQWVIVGITVAEARRGSCRVFSTRDCFNVAVPESAWRETLSKIR
jgi:hypothetical protein